MIGTSSREEFAFCIAQSLACSVDQLGARRAARAAVVLTTAGVGFFTAAEVYSPALGAGDSLRQRSHLCSQASIAAWAIDWPP